MIRSDSPQLSVSTWRATRRLALEAATAQVIGSFSARGVRAIVLKGPALAAWLYDGPDQRPYGDVDLLVAPHQFDLAEMCLGQLGFTYRLAGARPHEQVRHAHHWVREHPLRVAVDLHRSLYWIRIADAAAWETLSRDTDVIEIAGASVEVLVHPARALVVALHAAQHGQDTRKPLRDLERALAVGDDGLWREAADLATELDVRRPFAAGLLLQPAGIELVARLGLDARRSSELRLFALSPPPTSVGFHRLAEAGSWSEKLRVAIEKIFPTPPSLRAWQPVARRGAAGLALAYAWRPLWLLWKAPRGLLALVRAARSEHS
jgi:putative nucleotidyltransferase-like protein